MKKLIPLLLLTACSANGPVFKDSGVPGGDSAKIIIYKNYAMLGMSAGGYAVDVNGEGKCYLRTGSYFETEQNGNVLISTSVFDMPGTSKLLITTKPKEVRYIRIDVNSSKESSAIMGGLAGALIAEGASSSGGPFIISEISAPQALEELKTLRLQESCK